MTLDHNKPYIDVDIRIVSDSHEDVIDHYMAVKGYEYMRLFKTVDVAMLHVISLARSSTNVALTFVEGSNVYKVWSIAK